MGNTKVKIYHDMIESRKFTAGEKMAFLILKSYAGAVEENEHGETGHTDVSLDEISRCMGTSRQTCGRYLKSLEEKGAIKIHRRGLGFPNEYEFYDYPMIWD